MARVDDAGKPQRQGKRMQSRLTLDYATRQHARATQPISKTVTIRDHNKTRSRDNTPSMDDKLRQLRAPLVRVPPVPHQQLRQVAELYNAEVGRQARLLALLAHDPHPDVRSLDHRHVVAAIADAAHPLPRVRLDQPRDVGFLRRGTPAGDDGGERRREIDKGGAEVFEVELIRNEEDESAGLWGKQG